MTKDQFLRTLESQLGMAPGQLNETQSLAKVEGWDSLAAVVYMAVADEQLGVLVSGDQVAKASTVNDLLLLVGDKLVAS